MSLARFLVMVMFVGALTLASAASARADCPITYVPVLTDGAVVMQAQQNCGETSTSATVVGDLPPTDSGLDSLCVQTAMSMGQAPYEFCAAPPEDADSPVITSSMVAAALRVIPLPASALQVQPPNGRTLVNFDTNFFTDTREFDRTVTLLGQQVDLHIVPSAFGWHFGDGESLTTAEPGAPYPDLDVTHSYLRKGRVAPSVDTTYTAQFRVNGGPWRAVPGSVTIAGAPVDLQVLTATPTLVGYERG
jgi:hypothetical protein